MTISTTTITAASNTTPIQITTGTAHGLSGNDVVTIKDVTGNTAANGTWHTTRVDATKFTISATGNGAWTSGGTVQGPLGVIVGIVRMLSTEVRLALATEGREALHPNGEILLGSEHVLETEDAPRIVIVPDTTAWELGGPPQMHGASSATALLSEERKKQLAQKARLTDLTHFRVHVWGKYGSFTEYDDRELDYDATRELAHLFVRVLHETTIGAFKLTSAVWTGAAPTERQNVLSGREFVFGVEYRTPVLAKAGTTFIPSDAKHISLTAKSQDVDGGTPEQAVPPV